MAKKKIRLIMDIAMTVLLPMLMAYSLIGEKFHEIIGTLMFALFILHHVLKRYFVDKENQKIRLHPENKSMKDIIVSDCEIQGVAVKVIKDLA